jgi:hypothetical protein
LNPKFATALAARRERTSGSGHCACCDAGRIAPFVAGDIGGCHRTFTPLRLSTDHCPDIFALLELRAMVEPERFSVPYVIEEILERLPPQVALHVPDHILAIWFPPGPADGVMPDAAAARAQAYAQSCGCEFAYHGSIHEGIFYRLIASDN